MSDDLWPPLIADAIRQLLADGHVERCDDGRYRLTEAGREMVRETISRSPRLTEAIVQGEDPVPVYIAEVAEDLRAGLTELNEKIRRGLNDD